MSIKKVLGFTGIRSDYDLLSLLYKKLNESSDFEIKLIVSGAHLSETYGYTFDNIVQDKIPVIAKIENLIDSNSRASRIKSLSILLQDCIHTIVEYKPDIIIYAGDREEVVVGGLIGTYLRIPTIHFFGGDHALDGNIDNPIRHAVSKLSSLHFVSNQESKKRLIKSGEHERRIFNVGSPALDKFLSTKYINKKDVLNSLDRPCWDNYAVMIYHPFAGEENEAGKHFEEILISLEKKSIKTFASYPNVDAGNKEIIKIIDKYSSKDNFKFYKNLPRELFVNLLRNCMFMIGNSSAGLYEAPLLKLGAINVGNRQKGRLCAANVIFVEQGINNIIKGIEKVMTREFQILLSKVECPYGDGDSIDKIINLMRSLDFESYVSKSEDPLLMEGYYE
ncbi:UDP-N-acetylglucosamine 2-epimerase [Clostridium beijerinckii]|uniref:UDP-N-acetylglucosamine 2-epimerase n=1 Tax=Clostridium beijerinckii TaxID=1520 RepID=UPI000566DF10|nr:UDP-N-acetylglucosamine 2-epimerase [Clostridium beijerinckii]